MEALSKFTIYNTLTRSKERFDPLAPPFVGVYVCGPTVYGDPHLGHARSAITFDLLYRYLMASGYRVRYVRTRNGNFVFHDILEHFEARRPRRGCPSFLQGALYGLREPRHGHRVVPLR